MQAFTAHRLKIGKFEAANHGTIFFDTKRGRVDASRTPGRCGRVHEAAGYPPRCADPPPTALLQCVHSLLQCVHGTHCSQSATPDDRATLADTLEFGRPPRLAHVL